MKKHLKLIVFMLCIINLMVLLNPAPSFAIRVDASENGGIKKGLELYKEGNYSEAKKQFKKYKKTASEASVKNMS